jgi:exodeoxyribonuclease V gamma subunit
MPANITPGFIALHGNQMEELRAAVFGWMREHPLDPLEEDIFLVQSNGVAEWLKIALATEMGVCAATQVMLPARFLWQAYRRVLGPEAVPRRSAFERAPLTWRLMRLLPGLLDEPGFEPLRQFLSDGDVERRLQLAQRLSELPRDVEIVAYCRGPFCLMSDEAVHLLRKAGYHARKTADGVSEWRAAGLPLA